ncbi:hypothetical protein [Vibrio crassostreae]|uniref:hypothetical protein n=1 Tax=Vibrio crassostreae TaxID=246167 RepID=UPI001B3188E8|nr:hypothetical protein [Vibrio crassostreae]
MTNEQLFEEVTKILETMDLAFEESGYIKHRCLAATTLADHLLKLKGWKVELFPCQLDIYNNVMIQMVARAGRMPQSHDEAMDWRQRGARTIRAAANDSQGATNVEDPLGGHYCMVVIKDGLSLFVDASFGQFNRTVVENGWYFEAPQVLIHEIDNSLFEKVKSFNLMSKHDVWGADRDLKPSISLNGTCGGVVVYAYERLKTIEKLTAKVGSRKYNHSDLNLNKHDSVRRLTLSRLKQ